MPDRFLREDLLEFYQLLDRDLVVLRRGFGRVGDGQIGSSGNFERRRSIGGETFLSLVCCELIDRLLNWCVLDERILRLW